MFCYIITLPILGLIIYELIKSKNYIKLNLFFIFTVIGLGIFYLKFFLTDIIFISNWKFMILFLVLIIFIITVLTVKEKNFDIYLLFILVFIGASIIIISDHLLVIYLGLELQTFSLFILISSNKKSIKGAEAGLKYFILGALSSGLYLLGLVLFFINGVSLNLKDLIFMLNDSLVFIGCIFILISLSFKLTLAPFHFWIADIYEGSSWDVIMLIAIISKISVIVVFLQLIVNTSLIIFCCLLSVILGTIGAINQTKLKRLLAYSAISNVGFIILGFTIGNSLGYEVSFIYMFIYMVSSLFLFVTIISTNFLNNNFIIELGGLQYSNKILGLTWLLLLLSIAGIPPLSGFVGKWFVIWNTICFDYMFSSLILILFSIIGVGFYLRIIKIIYFQKKSSYFIWHEILKTKENTYSTNFLLLGFSVFFTVLFIININPLINITNYVIYYLF